MQVTIDTNHISARDMRLLSLVLDLVADEMKSNPTPREIDRAQMAAQLHPNDHPAIGGDTSPVNTAAMFGGNAVPAGPQVDTAALFGAGSTSTQPPAPAVGGQSLGVAPQTQQGASGAIQGAANVGGAVERDSEGYPWDERIHSSSKKKTDGGAWVLKKGINNDKAKLNRVKAELMQTMPLNPGAAAQQTNPAPVFQQASQQLNPAAATPMQQPVTLQEQMQQAGMIPPPQTGLHSPAPQQSQQIVPPNPAAQPQGDPVTLPDLMTRVGPMIAQGLLPPNALNVVVEQLGLPSLAALATTHATLVPTAWAMLKR